MSTTETDHRSKIQFFQFASTKEGKEGLRHRSVFGGHRGYHSTGVFMTSLTIINSYMSPRPQITGDSTTFPTCMANAPMKMPAVVAAVDTAVVAVVVATGGVAGVGVADEVGGTTTRRKKLRSKSSPTDGN